MGFSKSPDVQRVLNGRFLNIDVNRSIETPFSLDSTVRALATSATFQYRANRPWEVRMVLTDGLDRVPWVLSRDVLSDGVLCRGAPFGSGDVHVLTMKDEDVTYIRIESPDGAGLLRFNWTELYDFVRATIDVIELGAEEVQGRVEEQIDGVIARILDNTYVNIYGDDESLIYGEDSDW